MYLYTVYLYKYFRLFFLYYDRKISVCPALVSSNALGREAERVLIADDNMSYSSDTDSQPGSYTGRSQSDIRQANVWSPTGRIRFKQIENMFISVTKESAYYI